jgi:hypothetical protein
MYRVTIQDLNVLTLSTMHLLHNEELYKLYFSPNIIRMIKTNKLTAVCLENLGASTSHNPMGLHGTLQG